MGDTRAEQQPGNEPAPPSSGAGYWFTPIPVYLTEAAFDPDSPVNGSAVMLWAHLHRHYAWRKRVFPSYATLARETDQSESAVKRQLKALKEVGALNWDANYGPKGRSSNEYALAPQKPFKFDRTTAAPVEVKNELHRPVKVRNDLGVESTSDPNPQVKNDLGVKSTVELKTTTSAPTDPPATTGTEGGGGGDRQQEAEAFLQSLPAPWAAGRKTARGLAPLLLERATEQGWQLDADLAVWLARDLGPVRTTHASVLRARIDDLPKKPTAKTRASPTVQHPMCRNCGLHAPVACTSNGRDYCADCTTDCTSCQEATPTDDLAQGHCPDCQRSSAA